MHTYNNTWCNESYSFCINNFEQNNENLKVDKHQYNLSVRMESLTSIDVLLNCMHLPQKNVTFSTINLI